MSTYEKLIDEIVARLKGTVNRPAFEAAGVKVSKSPDNLAAYDKVHPLTKTRIMVSFLQDRYGTDENDTSMYVGQAEMGRIMYFNLSVESRKRYEATTYGELALQLLLGYKSDTIGGELYAFAATQEDFLDDIWYYRVVLRWKYDVLHPIESFRITGDEGLTGPDGDYTLKEIVFTPEQINVLNGETPGYLQYFTDENGNTITLPEGYVLVKSY